MKSQHWISLTSFFENDSNFVRNPKNHQYTNQAVQDFWTVFLYNRLFVFVKSFIVGWVFYLVAILRMCAISPDNS